MDPQIQTDASPTQTPAVSSKELLGRLRQQAEDLRIQENLVPYAENTEQAIAHLEICKTAIHHVLNAIANDSRKYWLMGNGTGSWEKLTIAAAAIWNTPLEKLRAEFQPRKLEYEQYCAELEANEKLLRHCRDRGITVESA